MAKKPQYTDRYKSIPRSEHLNDSDIKHIQSILFGIVVTFFERDFALHDHIQYCTKCSKRVERISIYPARINEILALSK